MDYHDKTFILLTLVILKLFRGIMKLRSSNRTNVNKVVVEVRAVSNHWWPQISHIYTHEPFPNKNQSGVRQVHNVEKVRWPMIVGFKTSFIINEVDLKGSIS